MVRFLPLVLLSLILSFLTVGCWTTVKWDEQGNAMPQSCLTSDADEVIVAVGQRDRLRSAGKAEEKLAQAELESARAKAKADQSYAEAERLRLSGLARAEQTRAQAQAEAVKLTVEAEVGLAEARRQLIEAQAEKIRQTAEKPEPVVHQAKAPVVQQPQEPKLTAAESLNRQVFYSLMPDNSVGFLRINNQSSQSLIVKAGSAQIEIQAGQQELVSLSPGLCQVTIWLADNGQKGSFYAAARKKIIAQDEVAIALGDGCL